MYYGLLVAVGVTSAVGDLLIFRWAKSDQPWALAASLASWVVSLVLFGLLLRWGGRSLGVTFVLAVVVQTAMVLAWDLAVTRSRWTWLEWLGVALAVAGVVLIEVGASAAGGDD